MQNDWTSLGGWIGRVSAVSHTLNHFMAPYSITFKKAYDNLAGRLPDNAGIYILSSDILFADFHEKSAFYPHRAYPGCVNLYFPSIIFDIDLVYFSNRVLLLMRLMQKLGLGYRGEHSCKNFRPKPWFVHLTLRKLV